MTINEIKQIIDKNDWDIEYSKFGIRIQEVPFELGDMDHNSHVWVDGEETEEELDGVCAIDIDSPEAESSLSGEGYFGNHIALIAGDHYEYGQDLGEIIVRDATVILIIK